MWSWIVGLIVGPVNEVNRKGQVCLSVCLCLPVCLFTRLPVSLSFYLSVCVSLINLLLKKQSMSFQSHTINPYYTISKAHTQILRTSTPPYNLCNAATQLPSPGTRIKRKTPKAN